MDAWPLELRIPKKRDRMLVRWDDGRIDELPAAELRRRCPSSKGRRERLDGVDRDVPAVAIFAVSPIGAYAVNIAFSDGHARGIYPLSFLRTLGAEATRLPAATERQ